MPAFSPQGEPFSTAGLSASLFAATDRYRLFAKLVYPQLVRARAKLEQCYCADNGRVALEPVLLLGVSILQDLDGVPDRQAVEMLRYHAGWNVALNRQLGEAGADAWQLLEWVRGPERGAWAQGAQVQLLARVFGEQFEVVRGQVTSLPQEQVAVQAEAPPPVSQAAEAGAEAGPTESPGAPAPARVGSGVGAGDQPELVLSVAATAVAVVPKGKGQLDSDRVQNPHDAEATYAVKGQGAHKKEHVGFKVQVAETVSEAVLARGEPTGNYLTGIVTHRAHESDEAGEAKMEQEQAAMGLAKPPVQYVDGAYVSAQKLAPAHAEGREINRFEFSTHCHECPRRDHCLGKDQRHRTLVVGEHHTVLQARRQEQQTDAFQARMKQRNAIEGTQSELVRGHGLRRARSRAFAAPEWLRPRRRGLAKARLQNYFIGAACNVKRWIRREAWKLRQAALALAGPAVSPDAAAAAATPVN